MAAFPRDNGMKRSFLLLRIFLRSYVSTGTPVFAVSVHIVIFDELCSFKSSVVIVIVKQFFPNEINVVNCTLQTKFA